MSEPHAGSDLAAMKTRATRVEDGWLLNGGKLFITNGQVADLVIVCAKTDPTAGAKGVSLFLVETSLPGFSRGKPIKKIGQHASDTAELAFDQLKLPADALLGNEGEGFRYLMQELPRERLGVGAQALGAIEGALALTLEYVTQRKPSASGLPIFKTPALRWRSSKPSLTWPGLTSSSAWSGIGKAA